MKLTARIKNAVSAFRAPPIDLNDERLLDWLGITSRDKRKVAEITYFTCLKMLSETMGKLPLKYYQEIERGKIRAIPDEMTKILQFRPNPLMTPTTFWASVELNCQHHGNAYVWLRSERPRDRYGGEYKPLDMWLMPTTDVQVVMDDKGTFGDKGRLYYQYGDKRSGEQRIFNQDEVLHFKTWYSLDGIMGEPVRSFISGAIDGALSSQEFMSNLYNNGLTASMAVQYTGDLNDDAIKKLEKKFTSKMTGIENAGKVVPIPMGLQITPLNMNLTDAQFFELRKYSALQIASAFGIKPNQINNYDKSSYVSSETQQLAFLVDTASTRMKAYEEEINYKCLTLRKQGMGFYYKFNEKAILRADSQSQMESLTKAVNNGIYTPNEAREYLDLPSEEGGDQLVMNGNYIPLTMVGEQYGKK